MKERDRGEECVTCEITIQVAGSVVIIRCLKGTGGGRKFDMR